MCDFTFSYVLILPPAASKHIHLPFSSPMLRSTVERVLACLSFIGHLLLRLRVGEWGHQPRGQRISAIS